jgi:hypothetical protein
MKERPILFSGPMVRAFLEDRKTNTRRVINFDTVGNREQSRNCFGPDGYDTVGEKSIIRVPWTVESLKHLLVCPFGEVGDRLWVKETYFAWRCKTYTSEGMTEGPEQCVYAADGGTLLNGAKWRPSIFMFRRFSRITLEITDARVQRLQEITEEDAQAEGALFHDGGGIGHSGWRHDINHGFVYGNARTSFAKLWDSLNAKRGFGWNENPWLWALTLRRVKEGA